MAHAPDTSRELLTLAGVDAALAWLLARTGPTATLQTDSRRVAPGDVFIAWPGHATDGRAHVGAALAAGASACLVESAGVDAYDFRDARIATLPGLKAATGELAHRWHGEPSHRLDLIATTGTNGKTSTAWWTAQALGAAGRRCGVIGTLGVGEPPSAQRPDATVHATGLTTPDPVTLHRALRGFVDRGYAACAVEASSIGIVEHRLDAARIRVALYTNFTPDHLDFHGDMASYWAAKRRLFDWPGLQAAVLNRDDTAGAALAEELAARGDLDIWTYTLGTLPARLRATDLHHVDGGLAFTVHEASTVEPRQRQAVDTRAEVRTHLIGHFNASNVLAVIGGLRVLGLPLARCAELAAGFTSVPGRMQRVRVDATVALPQVVVDYAHTADALDKALGALRPVADAQGGRLWCVFGCGGNRDASKRPVMGDVATRLADVVVVTSDNSRLEDPQAIVDQVLAGCGAAPHVRAVLDRTEAVHAALAEAAPEDVVLIAGKGHEDTLDVGGVKRPYSDIDTAAAALRARADA
ncbi:UDP-N-acetylmuramoyl-L-alanyl-D-glutamate--2,6-diaminopimelate ligase [Leptothrix discophora]|uniref:UDP-N-acetylmuramyl-tripeptide synthetase n=1 Tax=Leptothrix discophora TaxID=89 RepID=A0ABT9FZY5_LEPDI|nr:UDP-N-acetylmuramoyl-L-alanyl-D-glutamate--2,6-diaminopimelate ligase [Leptothrix discophora]MDP4299730.1 UDP-N-acetylmuramoyl-L-alanyl-D-glutamate--2,6-diaminopimelate ligase [Leptothrix discophora]